MGCKSFGVNQILVGLHRVGVVGLADALKEAGESGLTDREAIVDLLIDTLSRDNYMPERQAADFRTAIWREYLRFRGEDFSDFFSEIETTVRGEPGADRDRFVEVLEAVMAEFELKAVIAFDPAGGDGPTPQLIINGEPIVQGLQSERNFKNAVRKTISDW